MQAFAAVLIAISIALLCSAQTIDFDNAAPGSVPPGWTVAMTHPGGPPKWEVRKDPDAPSKPNVFAQVSADPAGSRYPLAIFEKAEIRDGAVAVKFKPVSGAGDQAAGIVWRYQNPDNYYIVRANALEDNVVMYKVEKGQRISLTPKGTPAKTYGVKHPVPKNTWSALKVVFQGNTFTVFFDGKQIFEVADSTFSGAGKTGLWTKADSVTSLDDFHVEAK
jgi:hypothetical protein